MMTVFEATYRRVCCFLATINQCIWVDKEEPECLNQRADTLTAAPKSDQRMNYPSDRLTSENTSLVVRVSSQAALSTTLTQDTLTNTGMGFPDASPVKSIDGEIEKLKMTRVMQIFYDTPPKLGSASLLVDISGRNEPQYFKYQDIKYMDGVHKALELFQPTWSEGFQRDTNSKEHKQTVLLYFTSRWSSILEHWK
ncbi:hypothetical protein N7540_010995 [Penicillium herquei]|nr:hypothetical protein N7540_010995 [Penicillium herquei]